MCKKKFCYFCDFCELLEGLLCLINFKSFLLLNLLFLRYLLACVFRLHQKFLLLLRHLRTSRGPSLPYKLQVFAFAKFVILAILAIFASVCFHVARKILATFAIFADFSRAFFAFLPFKSFLLLNLLFLLFQRYLLTCVFTLHKKLLLLLRYLRASRGPSLPYKLQVFAFAKFVILAILAMFARVCFHVARKILVTFAIFTIFADFSRAFYAL